MIQGASQSPVYYSVEEEILKNINRPEKREPLCLYLSFSLFLLLASRLFGAM